LHTSTPATFPFAGFPRPAASLTYTYDQVVSRALAQPVESPPRGKPSTGLVTSQLLLPLVFVLFLLVALVSLVGAWYSNDSYSWIPFWIFSGCGFLIYGLFLLGSWVVQQREQFRLAHPITPPEFNLAALRAAVLAGHDQIAPPITVPTDVSNGAVPFIENLGAEPLVLSLMPPERRLLRLRHLLFWALFVPICLLSSIEVFVNFAPTSVGQHIPWQIAVLGLMLPVELVFIFVVTNSGARPRKTRIEADGLHWGRFALPWSEMRGLGVLWLQPRRQRAALGPDAIYAVFGQHASLTWYVDAANDASVNASAALLRRVQSQTGLPLRDITPGFMWIDAQNPHVFGIVRYKVFTINDRTIGGIYMPSLRTALVLFCLATLVLLAGIGMPAAQQRYFDGQLSRLESAQDVMRDPLTSNHQQWTPMSANVAKSFAFTPQGYRFLSTTCCDSSSLIAQTIGNGLVEVTVHQQVDFDLDEAGIMFHVDPSSNTSLAFVVTPNGEWHLNRFRLGSDGTLTGERSLRYEGVFGGIRAIYQGHDTINRLAVLMQGSSYTFFVNGQYIGGYRSNDLPLSGQIGVYVGGMDGPVAFSDLLISPA
jgi:hypothetical protein